MAANKDPISNEEFNHNDSRSGNEFLKDDIDNLENEQVLESPAQKIKNIYMNINILRSKYKSNSTWSQEDEVVRVAVVCDILKMIHDSKSQTYGPSWKKHGWVASIFSNIARKFDRLENIMTNPMKVIKFLEKPDLNSSQEQIIDTFADLANYGILPVTELMITKPEMFDQWLKSNGIK